MKEYNFYGCEAANVAAVSNKYKSVRTPRDLYDALSDIWCADTCAPRMRGDWSPENKTLGQCSITAFLAQDIFGGKVYGIPREGGNFHCYNVAGGCKFDLTSEQFGDEVLDYENNPEQSREVHFAKEEKRLRYEYLKAELAKRKELRTERLILRPWRETDAESLYEYAKDPAIGPVAGWPVHTGVEESREIIRTVFAEDEVYAVCLREDNRAIGCAAITVGEKSNFHLPETEGEIGYWIGKPFWGRGLIPEAVRALIARGFDDLKLEKLWCGYFEGNEKSRRVQEKCGFKYHHTNKDIHWELMDDIRTEHVTCLDSEERKKNDSPADRLHARFAFRDIRPEEAERAAQIEQICFPPNEACSRQKILERAAKAPENFLVAVDKETGELAGFLNGIATDEDVFRDEFFLDANLHDPHGHTVMLLGLDVLPQYRGQGLAREIVHQYAARERQKGRRTLILTCLEEKVSMYQKMGFRDEGIANSTWGGEQWHEMSRVLE